MRASAILLITLALTSCNGSTASGEGSAYAVSLVQLLSNPSDFDGRRVLVRGYADHGGTRLYLTREHAWIRDVESAVLLSGLAGAKGCYPGHLAIEGTFTQIEGPLYGLVRPERVLRYSDATAELSECWKQTA